jgi:RNA polymerase sigma-70 factor (ECF subfamily)
MVNAATHGLASALGALAHSRDGAAWTVIVERVAPDMHRLAASLAGDDLGEDAVHEALLQIRDGAGSFTPRTGDPDGDARRWIMRVTSYAALGLLRRRQALQQRLRGEGRLAAAPAEAPQPGAHLIRAEDADLVRSELARLPEGQRSAIVLHCIEGCGFAAVASTMGIPEGTAKTWVRRGLEVMRTRLAGAGCAWSVAILAGVLHELPAASTPCAAASLGQWQAALHAPTAATLPAVAAGGLAVATKILIGATIAGALLAGAAVPVLFSSSTSPTAADSADPLPVAGPATRADAALPLSAVGLDGRIDIQVVDMPIDAFARLFTQKTGVPVDVQPAGNQPYRLVTFNIKEMVASKALDFATAFANAHWRLVDGRVVIASGL